nr:MAG TPA: hypothetical protein [Caudoviricetes sp.]
MFDHHSKVPGPCLLILFSPYIYYYIIDSAKLIIIFDICKS